MTTLSRAWCCCLLAASLAVVMGTRERSRRRGAPLPFPCSKLADVVSCKADKFASFHHYDEDGLWWMARDADGTKEVLIKLLTKEKDGRLHFMTKADMKGDKEVSALKEAHGCSAAQALQSKENRESDGEGARHFPHCLGSNIGQETDEDVPLYVLAENTGFFNLHDYIAEKVNQGTWGDRDVKQLFKQLMEALDYTVTFRKPWVLHTVEPARIFVKSGHGGAVNLYIGDLRESIRAQSNEAPGCAVAEGTSPEYAPAENTDCNFDGSDPKHFGAYDIFSAGSILFEMITGMRLPALVDKVNEKFGNSLSKRMQGKAVVSTDPMTINYKFIAEVAGDEEFLNVLLKQWPHDPTVPEPYRKIIASMDRDRNAKGFLAQAVKMLNTVPQKRPFASTLRGMRWITVA